MDNLRSELHNEKKHRERLEELNYKRDDQVLQLRTTFDQSLNTLSKDTRNIKSILGKSIKKLDREMGVCDVTEDDVTSSSEKTFNGGEHQFDTPSSGGRYSSPSRNHYLKNSAQSPHQHRSKSAVEIPVEEIRFKYSTPKVTPPPSSVSAYNNNNNIMSSSKRSPRLVTSNIPPSTHVRASYHETPTRDSGNGGGGSRLSSSDRFRENKRYSK